MRELCLVLLPVLQYFAFQKSSSLCLGATISSVISFRSMQVHHQVQVIPTKKRQKPEQTPIPMGISDFCPLCFCYKRVFFLFVFCLVGLFVGTLSFIFFFNSKTTCTYILDSSGVPDETEQKITAASLQLYSTEKLLPHYEHSRRQPLH